MCAPSAEGTDLGRLAGEHAATIPLATGAEWRMQAMRARGRFDLLPSGLLPSAPASHRICPIIG